MRKKILISFVFLIIAWGSTAMNCLAQNPDQNAGASETAPSEILDEAPNHAAEPSVTKESSSEQNVLFLTEKNSEQTAASQEIQKATVSQTPEVSDAELLQSPQSAEGSDTKEATSLRAEAYKSQRVQRLLRTAQQTFEKVAESIAMLVEKDEVYLGAIRVVDAPLTEEQKKQARREAVERAMQTQEVKKLKAEAQKHFEDFRKAYNAAFEAKKAVK